jgi:hypothetical protein
MRAFGWKQDGVTVETAEAEVLRRMARELLGGSSVRGLVAKLEAEGIRTATGAAFSPITVRRSLTNPRIIGKREVRGKLVPAEPDPILTADQYRKLRDRFASSKRSRPNAPKLHLLTGGLAVCVLCERPLFASPSSTRKDGYACSTRSGGCGRLWINMELLDQAAGEAIVDRLAALAPSVEPEVSRLSTAAQISEVLADVRGRKEALVEQFGAGHISQAQFDAGVALLTAREESLLDRQDRLLHDGPVELIESWDVFRLSAWWATAAKQKQRDLAQLLLDRVVVKPTDRRGQPGLDPERVVYEWSGLVDFPAVARLLLGVA